MIMLYLTLLFVAAVTDYILKEDIKKLLEKKGYVDKDRLERTERLASGNTIEYHVTKKDVLNWFKRNIWTFIPVVHLFIIGACFIRVEAYDSDAEDFYAKWIERLIAKEKVVPCNEEEIKNIHMIEEELSSIRNEKITNFLNKIGINININYTESIEEDTLEEDMFDEDLFEEELDEEESEKLMEEVLDEEEEKEQEEDDSKSTIEINISTPFGKKKYYRVIDSKKYGRSNLSSTEEDMVDKIMNSLDQVFDKADQKIDRAMSRTEQKIDRAMDKVDKKFDQFDEGFDRKMDKFDRKIDKIGEGIDSAIDNVDSALDKMEEVLEKILKL